MTREGTRAIARSGLFNKSSEFDIPEFPIVRKKDEKAHGRYRTKDRILEIYDTMLAAQRSGKAYITSLHPPPGKEERVEEGN